MHPLQIEGQSAPFPFADYGIKSAPRELAETHDVFKETLIKSFDELRTSGKLLIPFMVYSALVVELVEP